MKVFLDTNIFLDLIFKRKGFDKSLIILNAAEKGIFKCIVADISILNIDYIAKKQLKNIREFLTLINSIAEVIGANNNLVRQALDIHNTDLEDNLQFVLAQSSGCNLIVTNDKKFYTENIPIFTSAEFVDSYIGL